MRKLPALVVAAALLASLTACSTSAAPGSAGCTTPASGDASSASTVTGSFGSAPTVKIPTPINTKSTEVSTVIAGHGQVLTKGTPAMLKLAVYSGTTGKVVQAYAPAAAPITVGGTALGELGDSLTCARVGSRVAVAIKASDLTTSTTGATAKPNHKSGPAYIAVIDVVKAFLPKANGTPQLGVNNMPAVVTAANGAPGISIPDTAAPKSNKVQLIRKGSGETLTKKDTAVAQLTVVDWASTPTVQGSSWTNGDAATTIDLSSTSVPSAILKALIGQKVGSQVMVVTPGTDSSGAATTLVYVIDVLGAL